MTSKVTSSGAGTPKVVTAVNYYKGKKMRSEADKAVVLYDGEKGTMTNINTSGKSYSVIPMANLASNPMIQMVEITTVVKLQPGGKTRKILGKQAKNYLYTATISMNLKKAMLDRIKAQGGGTGAPPKMPKIVLSGENWVTEQINLPPGAASLAMAPMAAIPGLKPLLDKFQSVKGVPLETKVTISFEGAAEGRGKQAVTSVATTVSEETLADSLFVVPAGFTQTPATPGGGAAPMAGPQQR